MFDRPSRRDLLKAAAAAGSCAAIGSICPIFAQEIHAPEASLDRWHRGICGQCGLADPVFLGARGGRVVAVKGDPVSPTNYGRLCTRGMAFPAGLDAERRCTQPMLRRDPATKGSNGGLEPVSWDEALAWARDHAPNSRTAVFLDSNLPCESHHVARRLFGEHLGSHHIDTHLTLDAAAGVAAAEAALGYFAPPGDGGELDRADLYLVVGADPASRQATMFGRMLQCHRSERARAVVIDPRRTLTCGLADVWIRPKVPGLDSLVLSAILHALVRDGMAEVEGELPSPEHAEAVTGARASDIEAAAEAFADSSSTFTCYGRGLTRGGAEGVRALYNLHTACARWGDGSTVVPLLNGANAAGAWLMGRGTDRTRGLRLGEWPLALEDGRLDAVWLLGTNLLPLLPDQRRWRDAMTRHTLVAASAFVHTETTVFCDLVLPAAIPWLEERGTFVNQFRRLVLTDPAGPPEGVPTSLSLFTRLAETLVEPGVYDASFAEITRIGPEVAWEQARAATEGTVHDLSGATYALLTDQQPTWPVRIDSERGELSADGARMLDLAHPAPPDDQEGLALVVFADSHHTGARELTGFAPELHHASPRAWIEISGRDASQRKLRDGTFAAVESKTGVLVARLWITDRVPRGVVAVPEHFGFLSDLEGGTDGRAEPESLPGLVLPSHTDPTGQVLFSGTRVALREPTEEEMAARALKKV